MHAALARLIAVALVAFVAMSSARADDLATRNAKRYYEQGEKLFALGKFDEALEAYQNAFDAKPLPDFLYNIGQCYRNLGDLEQAIFSFKKYLNLSPNAPDRDKVEKLIADLEARQERGEGKKLVGPEPPPLQPAAQAHTPIYKQWWFWAGVAAVGVASSVGIYEATKSSPPATDLGNISFTR